MDVCNPSKILNSPNLHFFFSDVKTSRDTTVIRGRGRGERGRGERGGRGRGANTSRNNLIASSGLFSEGAGDAAKKSFSSRFRSSGDATDASSLRRPTIIKKEKIDPQLEQKHISDIYELESDLIDDNNISNDSFVPISLDESKFFGRRSLELR